MRNHKSNRVLSLFLVALLATTMFVTGCDRDNQPQTDNGIIKATDDSVTPATLTAGLFIGSYVIGNTIDSGWKVVTNVPVQIDTAFLIKIGDTDKVTVATIDWGMSESVVYPFTPEGAMSLLPYDGLVKVLPIKALNGDEVTRFYNPGLGEYNIASGARSAVTDPDPAPAANTTN